MKRSCLLLFTLAALLPAAAQRIDRSAADRHAVGRADTTRYAARPADTTRYGAARAEAADTIRYAAEPTDATRSDSVEHAGLTAAVESLLSAADRLASIADSLRTAADSLRALESPAPTAACVADAAIARAAAELPAATAGIPSDEEFRRTRQRFLPMRRRMDREIGKLKYAYKGELIMGFTASYGTLSSDETDFWLVLDNINASGTIATASSRFGSNNIYWATKTTFRSRSPTWICRAAISRSASSTAPTRVSTRKDVSASSPNWTSPTPREPRASPTSRATKRATRAARTRNSNSPSTRA